MLYRMKLLIFSDIHGDLKALERLVSTEADYYVCAGDLVTWARGFEVCGEILHRRGEKVYVLPGNHESTPQIETFCARYGLRNFHEQVITVGEYHVAGLGYSNPTPFNTPGEYSEMELSRRLEKFAELSPLVLICHAPPHGTALDRIRGGLHAGSTAVREFIDRHQPERFFCGHIHEAEGAEITVGKTQAVNVGKRGYLLELE
jgi:Icc-related predicted phosphoesterase